MGIEQSSAPVDVDVVVIGAGITGLLVANKLAELNSKVAVVEKGLTVAAGSTVRNEGWLHSGAYHAVAVEDQEQALQIVHRSQYGYEYIRNFAPQAIMEGDKNSFVVVRDGKAAETVARWDAAEVWYRSVLMRELLDCIPLARTEHVSEVFRVKDVAVNTRILLKRLVTHSTHMGAQLFTRAEITNIDDNNKELRFINPMADGKRVVLRAPLFVYATGYGTRDLFLAQHGYNLPMRFWKSHLLIMPRLTDYNLFGVEKHDAGIINHDNQSIVGSNYDRTDLKYPNVEVVPEKAKELAAAVRNLVHIPPQVSGRVYACVKLDLAQNSGVETLSVGTSLYEPIRGHFIVFPGKMTEAPFVADQIVQVLHSRLEERTVTLRPVDRITEGFPVMFSNDDREKGIAARA